MNAVLSYESVPDCFAQAVARYSNRIAVSASAGEWTYHELDLRSDFIASEIESQPGKNSTSVGLLLEHDAPLIASILGALKSNRIYVALEPSHPPELLAAMLASSGTKLLLADAKNLPLAASIASKDTSVLPVPASPSGENLKTVPPEIHGDSAAWLMFTSGSTGNPKGVWQNHRGLVQEGQTYAELAGITSNDRVALLTSCSLAASGSTLFGTLFSGAALYPFHVRSQGVERLATWLAEKRITVLHTVPTVFRHLGPLVTNKDFLAQIRLVRLGGEPVLPGDAEIFHRCFPENCQLMQSLSSTETGIICASIVDKKITLTNGSVPVGRSVPGVEVILLDENNQLVKNGFEGIIAVRSPRLKQGYWKQPQLTAERFISDQQNPTLRTFISNDIGRFLPDGTLEHLGRADLLVKIHGQRVNLGEVEAALLAIGFARELAVIAHEEKPGEKRLLGFVVPNTGVTVLHEDVRRRLLAKLPEHMVPAEFIIVETLPRTGAGKIDRAALRPPPPRQTRSIHGRAHRSRDVLDKRLMGIWESALKISPISRKDDFFELGGTSLQSVEVLLQIEEMFGVSLPPSTLVEYNTIEKLAGLVESRGGAYSPNVLVKLREGGDGRPLFLIHSRNGDVASYGFLARRLTGRPVYGLQSPGMMGESWPLTDLRAMAQRYLREILSHDPHGPYLLAGTCMGGMVAFELAQMLIRQGKRVGLVGLMDTSFPLPKWWGKSWRHKAYYAVSTPLHDSWQALRWKTIRGLGLGQSDRFLPAYRRFVARANGRAVRLYKPEIYPGKITLFLTSADYKGREDPRLMVTPMARNTQIVKISGGRAGLFQKPLVDELAQQLEHAITLSENTF